MKMECYCDYIGVCCCEIEKLSHHCVSELYHCCGELIKCCTNVSKHFDNHDYLNCSKIESLCRNCMKIKTSKISKTSKKVCPPGKTINPKTGRCINIPKQKTKKNPSGLKKTSSKSSMTFDKALDLLEGSKDKGLGSIMKTVKNKFGVTLEYKYGSLYFMKKGKEISRPEMEKVQQYIIDRVKKVKGGPIDSGKESRC